MDAGKCKYVPKAGQCNYDFQTGDSDMNSVQWISRATVSYGKSSEQLPVLSICGIHIYVI